jgi:hypothetical protein
MRNHDTVMMRFLEAIPWIKDCCKASTLPNILRVVLHVDAKYRNETISCLMENVESISKGLEKAHLNLGEASSSSSPAAQTRGKPSVSYTVVLGI